MDCRLLELRFDLDERSYLWCVKKRRIVRQREAENPPCRHFVLDRRAPD